MEVLQTNKLGFEIFFVDHIPTNSEVSKSYPGSSFLKFNQTHVRPMTTEVIF